MKDGYYFSGFADVSKLGNLYLVSQRHDVNFALWKKEKEKVILIHYWELERQTGIKHCRIALFDKNSCLNLIKNLLAQFGIGLEEIIEFWGIPCINKDEHYLEWFKSTGQTYHALSHLASCLFMDMDKAKTENILAFSVDGGSDSAMDLCQNKGVSERDKNQFLGAYLSEKGKKLELFSVSTPGMLWSMASLCFDLEEGTLMALASASESTAYFQPAIIHVKGRDAFNDELMRRIQNIISQISELTEKDAGIKFNFFDSRFTEEENKISMVMKIIQRMSYEIMDENIQKAIQKYSINPQETYLAMSGGFALNCPCNTYLMSKFGFKGFIAPPCVNDSGMSLGIGLLAFYSKLNCNFSFKLKNAYYGDEQNWRNEFIEEYRDFIGNVSDFEPRQAVNDLVNAPIVWVDGRAEIGPRALGARSILGDPRNIKTKDELNKIKKRQWWRPVAPIIIEEKLPEWFEENISSPYMLQACKIKADKRSLVPAVVHEDGSARMQTLSKEEGKERLLRLMEEFDEQYGIPIICNTSLNDKGEPIINTFEEAINFALRKKIHIMFFNGKRLVLKNFENFKEQMPSSRPLNIFAWNSFEERQKLILDGKYSRWNSRQLAAYTYFNIECGRELDEFGEEEQQEVMEKVKELLKSNKVYNKLLLVYRYNITKFMK